MSETRHFRGKIIKLSEGFENNEQKAKEILADAGKNDRPSYYDSWAQYLEDEFYQDFVRVEDALYRVEKEEVGEEDVFVSSKTEDGYKFEVQYYDGGMSFDEAIEEAVRNSGE